MATDPERTTKKSYSAAPERSSTWPCSVRSRRPTRVSAARCSALSRGVAPSSGVSAKLPSGSRVMPGSSADGDSVRRAHRRGGGRRGQRLPSRATRVAGQQRGGDRLGGGRALVPHAVDEERRRAAHPAGLGGGDVLAHPRGEGPPPQLPGEPAQVQPEGGGVVEQLPRLELVLVREQPVVHRPEGTLGAGGLDGLGGQFGVRVDVGQRQVPEDVAQVVAEPAAQLGEDAGGPAAERALDVAELDELQRGADRPAHVVALRVDRRVEQAGRRGVVRGVAPAQHPEPHRAQDRGGDRGREDADPRLVLERGVVEGEVGDEQGDGEAEPGQHRATPDAAQVDPRRQLAEAEPHRGGGRHPDAEELPGHQCDEDADGDRGGHRPGHQVGAEGHPGVGQREHRDDDVAAPGHQQRADPLVRRDGALHGELRLPGQRRVRRLAEGAGQQPGGLTSLRRGG